jgi:hypothetical protein
VASNLQAVRREIAHGMRNEGVEKKQVTHVFDPAVFIETGSSRIPKAKVTGFSTSVEIKRTQEFRRAKMSKFTQLVLHQLNSDKNWWFAATPQAMSQFSKKEEI